MNLGNSIYFIFFLCFISLNFSVGEEEIISSPLINIEDIKPSFEEFNNNDEAIIFKSIKKKVKKKKFEIKSSGLNRT